MNPIPAAVDSVRRWLRTGADGLRAAAAVTPAWEQIGAALVIGGAFAALAYTAFPLRPAFPELIPGTISAGDWTKNQDYVVLAVIVAGFALSYLVIGAQLLRVPQSGCPEGAAPLRQMLGLSLLPAALWLGNLLIAHHTDLECLFISAGMAVFAVALSVVVPKTTSDDGGGITLDRLGAGVLVPLLGALAGFALLLAAVKIRPELLPVSSRNLWLLPVLFGLVSAALALGLTRRPGRDRRLLPHLLFLVQTPLPLLYLALIPPAWTDGSHLIPGFPTTGPLLLLVAALILAGLTDVALRWRRMRRSEAFSLADAISPFAVVAILLVLKLAPAGAPQISPDEYHSGEKLLPWALTRDFGAVPFWDYVPARGLTNYVYSLFGSVFFDGTVATHEAAAVLAGVLYLGLGYLVFRRCAGNLAAFAMVYLLPAANSVTEIDLVTTVGLCVVVETFFSWRRVPWLAGWLVTGTALVLFAPGQGALLVLATIPIGVAAFWRAWQDERRHLLMLAGAAFGVGAVLLAVTPLGRMLFGAVRYGVEQSAVNTVAYGMAWRQGWGAYAGANPLFWELARSLWIGVALTALVAFIRGWALAPSAARTRLLAYSGPIAMVTVLYIQRAAARIDPSDPSRLGHATMWATAALLPLVLIVALAPHRRTLGLMVACVATGVLAPFFRPLGCTSALAPFAQSVPVNPAQLVEGAKLGLPNMGRAAVEPQQLRRLQTLRAILGATLNPGETYLDLTNRNAQSYYLGYPLAIEAGAFYNLPTESQQLRAVERLSRHPPPVALVYAQNPTHDGGPASVRAHLIYRWLMENYTVTEGGGMIFMVRADRANRLETAIRSRLPADSGEGRRESIQPADFSDVNWNRGVLRSGEARVFVSDGGVVASGVQEGDTLVFAGAGARAVTLVQNENIRVDGPPLDPTRDGFPHAIRIVRRSGATADRPLSLLDIAFRPDSLAMTPMAWGHSFAHLQSRLRLVSSPAHAAVSGSTATFELSGGKVKGREAGILVFNLACSQGSHPQIEVSWGRHGQSPDPAKSVRFSGAPGKVVLPLDAYPRWLLDGEIGSVQITLSGLAPGETFEISKIGLFQRQAAEFRAPGR